MFDTIGLSRAAVAWSGADSMGDGGHVPPLLQMDGHGGTVSRTANKKLTKLYWPLRKRSPKRLIVLLEPKSGGARPPPPLSLRTGAAIFKFVPAPLVACNFSWNRLAPVEGHLRHWGRNRCSDLVQQCCPRSSSCSLPACGWTSTTNDVKSGSTVVQRTTRCCVLAAFENCLIGLFWSFSTALRTRCPWNHRSAA